MKIYLACPYSHPKAEVRRRRFRMANKATAYLMKQRHVVFSPISMTHPIARQCDLPKKWGFWVKQDFPHIEWADLTTILTLNGWRDSRGVKDEIKETVRQNKPVDKLSPEVVNRGQIWLANVGRIEEILKEVFCGETKHIPTSR